jgi:curved DNA-binding protein CbpA
VATEQEPEIFSEVQVCIELPWGGQFALPARIVHIMSADKARAVGIEPGLGLEFLDPTAQQKEGVEQLVKWARDSDPKRRVPRRTAQAPAADLNPMHGYVLSAIDGERSLDDIAERLELERDSTETVVGELVTLGLVEVDEPGARAAQPDSRRAEGAPATSEGSAAKQLSDEQRRAIDAIHARLAGDHYQVLAVLPVAPRENIRDAYFSLSKQFHPDAYEGHTLGPYKEKLFEVFERLTEAYAALSSPAARQQYDDYLRSSVSAPPLAPVAPATLPGAPAGLRISQGAPQQVSVNPAQRVSQGAPARISRPATGRSSGPAPERGISQVPATVRYERAGGDSVPAQPSARPAGTSATPQVSSRPLGSSGGPGADASSADVVKNYLDQAQGAFRSGDMKGAARLLDLLDALQWNRPELQSRYDQLEGQVTAALAPTYEQQARYEAKHQRWRQAARSWMKVCRAKPADPECHLGAAEALMRAKSDLRKARDLAQRAVELAPTDARARRLLGHIYLEAGLHLNARRELEAAAALNRHDADTQQLLERVSKRPVT